MQPGGCHRTAHTTIEVFMSVASANVMFLGIPSYPKHRTCLHSFALPPFPISFSFVSFLRSSISFPLLSFFLFLFPFFISWLFLLPLIVLPIFVSLFYLFFTSFYLFLTLLLLFSLSLPISGIPSFL